MNLRLVRNAPLEAYLSTDRKPTWWAPLYDVEETDASGIPVRLHAIGATAEQGRAVIARLTGENVTS